MSTTPTILPTLPSSLKTKRPAISVTELVSQLRTKGNINTIPAEGLERHQHYLDSLNNYVGDIIGYLQSASVTPSPSGSVDSSVWNPILNIPVVAG